MAGVSRPDTGLKTSRLDFLPKLSFQNFETKLPNLPSNVLSISHGKKSNRRPMSHPYIFEEKGSHPIMTHNPIPVLIKSHDFQGDPKSGRLDKKLIWRPKSGRVNIQPIETPSLVFI